MWARLLWGRAGCAGAVRSAEGWASDPVQGPVPEQRERGGFIGRERRRCGGLGHGVRCGARVWGSAECAGAVYSECGWSRQPRARGSCSAEGSIGSGGDVVGPVGLGMHGVRCGARALILFGLASAAGLAGVMCATPVHGSRAVIAW